MWSCRDAPRRVRRARGRSHRRATGTLQTATPPKRSISSGFVSALVSVSAERPFSTTTAIIQSSCPSRLEREQRVVYRAEPRAGDEHERKPEPAGEVGDRPVLAHRHEQPAGAFDDEQVVAARELRRSTRGSRRLRRAGSRAARPRAARAARRRSTGRRRAVRRSRRQPPAAAWRPPPDRQPGRRSGPASRRRRRGHAWRAAAQDRTRSPSCRPRCRSR